MTTDLDGRIARALGAKADRVTVERPALDLVLDRDVAPTRRRGTAVAAIAAGIVAVVVIGAAAVVATRSTSPGPGPADEVGTTTTEVAPEPDRLPTISFSLPAPFRFAGGGGEPSLDGQSSTFSVADDGPDGPVRLAITMVRATRSAPLADALVGGDGTGALAAYVGGGSVPASAEAPVEPDWVATVDPVTTDSTVLVVGGAPILAEVTSLQRGIGPIGDVGALLVGFWGDDVEVRVAAEGLTLGQLTTLVHSIEVDGLVPVRLPAVERLPTVGAGAPLLGFGLAAVPDGLVLDRVDEIPGVAGEETVVVRHQGGDPETAGILPAPPWVIASLVRGPVAAEVLAASEGGDPDALLAATDAVEPSFLTDVERRVAEAGGRLVVVQGSTVDTDGGTEGVDGRSVLRATVVLGPDATLTLESEGLDQDSLLAILASAVVLT